MILGRIWQRELVSDPHSVSQGGLSGAGGSKMTFLMCPAPSLGWPERVEAWLDLLSACVSDRSVT